MFVDASKSDSEPDIGPQTQTGVAGLLALRAGDDGANSNAPQSSDDGQEDVSKTVQPRRGGRGRGAGPAQARDRQNGGGQGGGRHA